MTKNKTIKMGVVGCGGIAQHAHLPSIQRVDETELVAVSDIYPDVAEKVAVTNGLARTAGSDDYRNIFGNPEIEAVCICAPTTKHAGITIEALEAGKHVLVEKPMAVTSAECETMITAAEKAGKTLMVGYNHTYDPAVRQLKAMLDAGELGEILYAEAFFYEDLYSWTAGAMSATIRSENQQSFWPQYDNDFENMREFLHNFGSHVTNCFRILLGEPEAIRYASGDAEKQFVALLDYPGFPLVFKNVRVKQAGFEKGVEICGTKKRVRLDFAPPLQRYSAGKLTVYDLFDKEKGDRAMATVEPFLGFGWPFEEEHRHFAQCLLDGKTPLTDGRQGIGDVRLAEELSRMATG